MSQDAELAVYFEEAHSWDADRAAQHRRSAKVAWGVAGAGWLALCLTTLALLVLMPLKRVEPFVIRVDNSTGLVDVVPVYAGQSALSETVTRYLLTHYVRVCERFNFATAEEDYEECGAFHTAQRNAIWYALWNPNNPASPLNLYKDGSSVRVEVISVSFFKRASGVSDLAQVRYLKAKRTAGGVNDEITHFIATIEYAYASPSKDPKVRAFNPLGFKIVDFTAEPEVQPDATSAHASTGSTPSRPAQPMQPGTSGRGAP